MKTSIVLAALGIAALTTAANADYVDVQFVGTGKGSNVQIDLNGSKTNVFAGQLKHTLSNTGPNYNLLSGTVVTFCTELTQYVTSTTKQYSFAPVESLPGSAPMGAAKAQAIQDVYNLAAGAQLSATANSDYAAAFQIAVWEIVSDFNPSLGISSLSLSQGILKVKGSGGGTLSTAITNAFNTIVAGIGQTYAQNMPIVGITNATAQDQIVQGQSFVPAPGAAALASLGLLAVARRRR